MLDHIRQRQDQIKKSISSSIGGVTLSDSVLEKAASDFFEKGGKGAVIGEIRTFGGRQYIKTHEGWKFHGKGTGKKAQEHKNSSSKGQVEREERKLEEDIHKYWSPEKHNEHFRMHYTKSDELYNTNRTLSDWHHSEAEKHRRLASEKQNALDKENKKVKNSSKEIEEGSIRKFESPEMESPIYAVRVNGVDRYIQKMTGISSSDTAYYEVVKNGNSWDAVQSKGAYGYGMKSVGDNKKEAVNNLIKYGY